MAVREYIGSRYVPIFGRKDEDTIIWDNTGTYEPLTVVLYQGNSYTSRQFVPVGIDITNEEFWAQTGNYNAQVEQYRQAVLTFDGRITGNTNAIQTINGKIGTPTTENTIMGDINELKSETGGMAAVIGDENTPDTLVYNVNGLLTDVDAIEEEVGDENTPNTLVYNVNAHDEWIAANNRIANVKQFGAVGDGNTDDTAAIRAALATGYDVYFPCLNNEVYLVLGDVEGYEPLVLNTRNQVLFSDFQGRTIDFWTSNSNTVLFDIQKPGKLEGITIAHHMADGSAGKAGIAIRATDHSEDLTGDTDVLIERCGFSNFNIAIDYTGRGLYVGRSQLTGCNVCIDLKWAHDSQEGQPGHGAHMSNTLGHRSHRIINNRFHSNVNTCIQLQSNVPDNTDNLNGIMICDNMMDYSVLYFIHATCSVRYALIANNHCYYGTERCMYFEKPVFNCNFIGNNIFGSEDFHRWKHGLYFNGQCVGCAITGNTFSNSQVDDIYFEDQANSCSISGNTFNATHTQCIVAHGNWNRVAIVGNSGNMRTKASGEDFNRSFVNCGNSANTLNWNHVKIGFNPIGNTEYFILGKLTGSGDNITNNLPNMTDTHIVYNFGSGA